MLRTFWKQFAALGIGYAHKYKFDPFFRTEANVITLHIAFTLVVLLVVAVAFGYLYRDISETLLTGIQEHIGSESSIPSAGSTIVSELEYVNQRNLVVMALVFLLFMLAFSYFIARVALKPTRDALASQKQFIGNIAHELRTPLSIIKTNTEVTLLDNNLGPSIHKMLKDTIVELDRTSDIINNLLSLNAFMRPEKIEFTEVDLGQVVHEAVRKLSDLAKRKQVEISIRKSSFLTVIGNASALQQIAINLIKNAIVYTRSEGTVIISIGPNYHGYIDLTVQDSGIGIARKDLFRIFEPFYRADQSRARQYGGSGLGLAIVNELVKLHGGRIAISSAVRKGTTVVVSIPCGKAPDSQSRTAHKSLNQNDEIEVDFSSRRSRRT
jgi:signal transduction histidine kinase